MRLPSLCRLFLYSLSFIAKTSYAAPAPVEILERVKSPFNGELTVVDYNGTRNLLARGIRGVVLQSSMDRHRESDLTLDYAKVMALMTGLHPNPTKIFNLGLGGGELPRFQLRECSNCIVKSAEIDPSVLKLALKYFNVSHPRHKILDGEGFSTLKNQTEKYDVIWVDAVLPTEGPRAYMNAKDLEILRGHLQENGTIIANLGETKSFAFFSQAEKGYMRSYTNGIRVKIPVENFTETLSILGNSVIQKVGKPVRTLFPSYLIAVSNSSKLNCKQFWSLYESWTKKKLINLKWEVAEGAELSEYCQDLN